MPKSLSMILEHYFSLITKDNLKPLNPKNSKKNLKKMPKADLSILYIRMNALKPNQLNHKNTLMMPKCQTFR